MLNSLNIINFKSLRSLDLPELGRINLFVGKNNSGKTSVLESLRVLSSNGSIRTLIELAAEREDQGPSESSEELGSLKRLIASAFTDYAIDTKEIRIGDFSGSVNIALKRIKYSFIREPDVSGVLIGKRRHVLDSDQVNELEQMDVDELDIREGLEVSTNEKPAELVRIDRDISRVLLDNAFGKKELLASCAYVPARPNDIDELANIWDQISLLDSDQEVVKALKLIEPSIAGLTFVETDPYLEEIARRLQRRSRIGSRSSVRRIPLVKLEGSNVRVPLRSMGDGLHRILDVVLRLVAIENGFLLIDEFENGLHYSIHSKLWQLVTKVAAERSVQVFATTHSDDCVQAFSSVSLSSKENGVLYRIARPQIGHGPHFVRRYSEELLADAENYHLEVR